MMMDISSEVEVENIQILEHNENSKILPQKTILTNCQKMNISSLSLDKNDLRKLCDILQERSYSAAEIEIRKFRKDEGPKEQYENVRIELKKAFELDITIVGNGGESLFGTIEEVFDSPNFPDEINSLYINNKNRLKVYYNYSPSNSFTIFIDFDKPEIFDFTFIPSLNTPNSSNIEVTGYDATWVNGVFSELKNFVDGRSSTLSIIHNHSIYDILLWMLGFPLSFWFCWELSSQIESLFNNINIFTANALYLYVFMASLVVFRSLFHYLRWTCPLVEFRYNRNKSLVHRTVLFTMITGWVGRFLYDIVLWLSTI